MNDYDHRLRMIEDAIRTTGAAIFIILFAYALTLLWLVSE